MRKAIALYIQILKCWNLVIAIQYQYDIRSVNVFTKNTNYDMRSTPNNDLSSRSHYNNNVTLQKNAPWLFVLAEEYFVTNASVNQNNNKLFQITLINSGQSKSYNYSKRQTPSEVQYEFDGMNSKFIKLFAKEDNTLCQYFIVYSYQFKKPSYFDTPDANQYSIYEASYFSSGSSLDLKNDILKLASNNYNFKSITPLDTEFDVSPVAWFTVRLSQVQLIDQFLVQSSTDTSLNFVEGIWLSFRLNESRSFISYKENNQIMIFNSIYVNSRRFSYSLLNPFIATEIRVHINAGNPLMNFKMDFRFIESSQHQFKKWFVGSFTFSPSELINITLDQSTLISGLVFDNVNSLLEFCIYYDVNDKYVPYRDSKLFNDDIIFTISPEIYLIPFRTSKLQLSCLKWFTGFESNITISLKGSHYLTANYFWSKEYVEVENKLAQYTSKFGDEKLYGDSRFMQKTNSLNRLMSNHFGPNCYTQPHLCDTGFTVQLDVAVQFSTEDIVLNVRPSNTFYTDVSDQMEPELIMLGCFANQNSVASFFFADVKVPSNAKVTYFQLNIGNSFDCNKCEDFIARAYLMMSQGGTFRANFRYLFDKEYPLAWPIFLNVEYTNFSFNGNKSNSVPNTIDLLNLFERVKDKHYGLMNDIGIVIMPDGEMKNDNHFAISRSGIVLTIAYQLQVVGVVKELIPVSKSATTSTTLSYNFDQVYYLVGMELNNDFLSQQTFTLEVECSDVLNKYQFSKELYFVSFDKYQLEAGESVYIAFNETIRTKALQIGSSTVKFYGSEYVEKSAPIISAGLGGYQTKTHGFGFQIHLNNDNKIVATVVTKNSVYEAGFMNPSDVPYILTLVWSKQDNTLNLYVNGALKDNATASNNNLSSNRTLYNEYLLVYADYNSNSNLYGSLGSIKMWDMPLSAQEIFQLLDQKSLDWSSLDASPPPGFSYGSDCYCKNVVCPCETLEHLNTVEYISRFSDFVLISEDDYFDEDIYVSLQSNSASYFDDIVLDFKNVWLNHVYIEGKLVSPKSNTCSEIKMQFLGSNEVNQTQWCGSTSSDLTFITPDLVFLLTHLLKTVSYTRPLTIMVTINNVVLQPESVLKIKYNLPKPDGFIQANASQQNPQDLLSKISLNIQGPCLSFKFKFSGNGFVSLVVLGLKDSGISKELAFFYRREALDKWVEKELDLSNEGEHFVSVEFIALKNGLGSGYIAFGTFHFLSVCTGDINETTAPDLKNSTASSSSFLNLTDGYQDTVFDRNLFYPAIFVKGAEVFTTFANPNISQDSNPLLLNFIHGHKETVFSKSFYFEELVLNKDFTLIFWFYSLSGSTSSSRVMNFVYGKEMVIEFQGSSIYLKYDGKTNNTIFDSLNWHFVVVQYERLFSRLSLEIDFKARVSLDNISFPTNSSMQINLKSIIFCFQMFQEMLFPSAIKAAQLCDNRPVELACTRVLANQTNPCKWCNSFYGEWELFPYRYIFDKDGSCIEDVDDFKKTWFQPFNNVYDQTFEAGIANEYEVKLASVKMVPGFINNGISVNEVNVVVNNGDFFEYNNSTFMFSIWIKQTCNSWDKYEHIVTFGLVALVCDKLKNNISTTVTPVMAFYNECLFALPGRSGLWYNFAFVLNESISFYINGDLVSSECIPSKSHEIPDLLIDSNIYVSKVGSTATLVDEIFVGDVRPNVLFWRQLAGNINNVEKIRQMTEPTLFQFCSNDIWGYDDSLPGSYLYEKVVYNLELQLTTQLRSSVKEFLLAEISSMQKLHINNKPCGVLNVYLTNQSESAINDITKWHQNQPTITSSLITDDLLEYYVRHTSYSIRQRNKTYVVLSLNIFEDVRYPISSILVQYGKTGFDKQLYSYNVGFIFINQLEIFTEYQVCFAFKTIRRKLGSCIQCKNFKTAEGEPVVAPDISCALNEIMKKVNCNITQISTTSWIGVPHSYKVVYRIKVDGDLCNTLQSGYQNQTTITLIYNATNTNSALKISIDTSSYHYKQLCIFAFATTQNGNGIGVWNHVVVRTQSEAPDTSPQNFIASFNETSIKFKWDPFENSTDAWNNIVPGFYKLQFGLVKKIPIELDSGMKVNITDSQYIFKPASLCDVYAAQVSAFSVALGPKSTLICILSPLKKPDCVNPVIKKVNVSGPRSATIFHESVNSTHFRGKKYWFFNVTVNANGGTNGGASGVTNGVTNGAASGVANGAANGVANGAANGGASGVAVNAGGNTVEGYNPGSLSEEYLKQPIEFEHSLESLAGDSVPCDEAKISAYFNQSTSFELNLRGLHPYVSYQVSIQPCNEMGCGNVSKSVSFQTYSDIPGCEPESLRLQNESSTSMLVSWNKLNASCENGVLLDYILSCNRSQSGPIFSRYSSISTSLQNLSKYELVCCRVAARNVNGTGPFSSEKCAYTDEDTPDAVPIIIRFKTTPYTIHATIEPPDVYEMNGIVVGIHATITNYSFAGLSTETETLQNQSLSVTEDHEFILNPDDLFNGSAKISFDNLVPSFVYKIELWYFTRVGNGSWSNEYEVVTAESLPDAPEFISNSSDNVRTIRISWSGVPIEKSHGVISSYRICRKQMFSNATAAGEDCFHYVNFSLLQFNFSNLDRGSTHRISVAACNQAGCGREVFVIASAMGFIDGRWLEWSKWDSCSQTCDQGKQKRARDCTPHTEGGYNCSGDAIEYRSCQLAKCSGFVLGEESQTNCTAICFQNGYVCSNFFLKTFNDTSIFLGATTPIKCPNSSANIVYSSELDPSFDNATGNCIGYINLPDEIHCETQHTFSRPKMQRLCNCISPEDYGFTKWAKWSFCSKTCGEDSIRVRKRNCIGNVCSGKAVETEFCDMPECPVDGEWGNWGEYQACNETCGYGYEIRTRECNNPPAVGGGTPCQGIDRDEQPECNAFPCPVNGGFSNWTEWSICDRPCGNGLRTRRRYCNNPVPALNGLECNGTDIITEPCFMKNCTPVGVNMVQRIHMTWNWRMYKILSQEAQDFVTNFTSSVQDFFTELRLKGLSGIEVTGLQAGSIIINYVLKFDYLHDQIVEFLDGIDKTGTLMNISVASTIYYSNDVPCLPPYNISVSAYDKNTVMLTWLKDPCNKTELWFYVFYRDISVENSTWQRRGLDLSSAFGFVPDLITSHKYKAYMLTAHENGNGLPSVTFTFQAVESPPERPPPTASSFSPKPTEIYIEWTEIPEKYQNGKILGYRIRYKIYRAKVPYQEVEAQFGFYAFTIKNLKPSSLYLVEVYGYNSNGDGPVQFTMCKTIEGVPSVPVPGFKVNDMQSMSWWSVSWNPIPQQYVNGILRGYRLVYYLSYQSGMEIGGEKKKVVLDFDKFTLYYKQRDILNYAVYNISVAGFTVTGSGPAPEYQARTCKCAEQIYANLYIKNPFTVMDSNSNPSGFFIKLLQEMVIQSCGSCQGYSNSELYFTQSKFGDDPVKSSEFELKNSINDDVDLSFPIYGIEGYEVAPDSIFSMLVKSPGILMVVRDENKVNDVINKMILGVFNVWPLLLISYAIASLFGILIWFTDQFANPDQFSKGSSLRGPLSGFWFTFVTMTTIGYGDLSPRSIPARTFALIWFLTGLILNGLIVGFIVTNLTSLSASEDLMLYDSKVAVLKNSFEERLAVLKNAKVTNFTDIPSMLDNLQQKVVDIVYVDAFSMMDYQSVLDAKSLKVQSVENKKTGYGFVMSGFSMVLTKDIESFIGSKSDEISAFAASFNDRIPTLVVQDAGQVLKDIFSKDSPAFHSALKWLALLIGCFSVVGVTIDVVRHIKNKSHKIRPQLTFQEELNGLSDDICDFHQQLSRVINEMSSEQDEEKIRLSHLKHSYANKVERLGLYEAERMAAMNNKYGYITSRV